jgi:hypothetical protein
MRWTDRDALHLAAGKLGGAIAELGLDAQQRSDLDDTRADPILGPPAARRAQRKGQIVEHRVVGIERVLLEHEGDVARRRRLAGHILAADPDSALIRRLEAGHQAERGRLAGAGRPEQNHELAVANRERQLVHGRDLPEPLGRALDYDLSHARLRSDRS